jgi:TetR/AcrR family transcriptional regulator, acrAB operon repressor
MARCTKQEALETRSRILDAAENIFHAQGVSCTSLADVAQAANLTRGAIYWHFKNKSDLFDAMCKRTRLPVEAMVEETADERESDPIGKLRSTCVFVLQEVVHNPHSRKVIDIVFHKCEFVNPADPILIRQREWFAQCSANIERVLRNAMAKGQLPENLDTHLAGTIFHATFDGLLKHWLFSPGSFDLAKDAEKLIDICIDTLRTVPSLRRQ